MNKCFKFFKRSCCCQSLITKILTIVLLGPDFLFVWILNVPVNIYYSHVDRGFGVERFKLFAQGHNAVPPVRLEPATPLSQVKHSTTEPSCSLLGPDISYFENSLDPDSAGFFRSQLIKILTVFDAACKIYCHRRNHASAFAEN